MKQVPAFYSAGFIYNPRTKRVLLAKKEDTTEQSGFVVAMFGGMNKKKETADLTFQRELYEATRIKVSKKLIQPLYDYFNDDFNTHRHVFFVSANDIKGLQKRLKDLGITYDWVSLDEVFDQNLSKRTKQDITFFNREIDAKLRSLQPEISHPAPEAEFVEAFA